MFVAHFMTFDYKLSHQILGLIGVFISSEDALRATLSHMYEMCDMETHRKKHIPTSEDDMLTLLKQVYKNKNPYVESFGVVDGIWLASWWTGDTLGSFCYHVCECEMTQSRRASQ